MKKLLLFTILTISLGLNAQVVIYDTTHTSTNGTEITGTANGPATSYGDAIKLAGTQRFLDKISVDLFSLTVTTPYTVTMSLYTDCPSIVGVGTCGSGIGTLIPNSTITVNVTPPTTAGTLQVVDFPYNNLNLTSEVDNTITVMINASRNNVFWTINETPVIGSLPDGDTAPSTLSRCGSTVANNGCNRTFAAPTNNNVSMKITAFATLSNLNFSANLFSISPNPANDFVNISNSENIKVSSVKITDLNGRVVKQNSFDSVSDISMNVSDLSSGIYMMNINSSEGSVIKKIIKN